MDIEAIEAIEEIEFCETEIQIPTTEEIPNDVDHPEECNKAARISVVNDSKHDILIALGNAWHGLQKVGYIKKGRSHLFTMPGGKWTIFALFEQANSKIFIVKTGLLKHTITWNRTQTKVVDQDKVLVSKMTPAKSE